MADGLLSLKALLGFSGFSTCGFGDQIQEYQRLFADIFECMGLAGAGDGNVPCADLGLFARAVGKQAFARYDDVNVFVVGVFVFADGCARWQGQPADFFECVLVGSLMAREGKAAEQRALASGCVFAVPFCQVGFFVHLDAAVGGGGLFGGLGF